MGEVIGATPALDGVVIVPLRQIADARGTMMHMLRIDSPLFEKFGEIYFSLVKPGAVKAWKRHARMTQNFAVPVGKIKLVLYDDRAASPTRGLVQEVTTGAEHYGLIHIPALVWYGFQGIAAHDSLIANCATLPHDPNESEQADPATPAIPYVW